MDRVIGRHVYADLYGCPRDVLENEEYLVKIVKEAAEQGDINILEIKHWKVSGQKGGVSILALIVESHIALHTWPNYSYATLDIYTCGEKSDPWKAFKYLIEKLKPKYYVVHYTDRSQLPVET